MDNSRLFTFSIITYNRFDGIFRTLDSLFIQDYPRIELVVSDDGSPNYEIEIERIKKYVEKNKGDNIESVVYTHFEKNKGTTKNINNVINVSNGYYIKILGCDDELVGTTALSIFAKSLEETKKNIVFAKMVGMREDGTEVKHLASCEEDYDLLKNLSPKDLCEKLYVRNCLPAPAWCAKRELFKKNGLFFEEVRLIEDYPYWMHLCRNNERIGFLDKKLVRYRLSGVSSGGSYGIEFMNDMFTIYERFIFPFDNRFGFLQPVYNRLKLSGLEAYMAKAKWNEMKLHEKTEALIKYGFFFVYIEYEIIKYKIMNRHY